MRSPDPLQERPPPSLGRRAPPRPAPPGRGPARLAARGDRRQVRPRGERVRGAGARAAQVSDPSPVQPPLPHLRPTLPEPAQCRPNSDRLEGTWSRVMGPVPGPATEGGAPAFPGGPAFVPWSRRPEAAIVCAPGRRVGHGRGGGVSAPPEAVHGAGPRGLQGPGAGAPGGETLSGERGPGPGGCTPGQRPGQVPATAAGGEGLRSSPSVQEGGRVRSGKPSEASCSRGLAGPPPKPQRGF